jgi:hypothetical protein
MMLDANTFGMGGAIWAPAAIALAWRLGRGVWLGALVYAVLASGMWFSGSRTALLALSVGTAGIAIALAERRGIWQPRMAAIALFLGAAVLVLAMAIAPRGGNSPSPVQRVFDRLPRLEAAEIKRFADEMWTRFGYGQAAATMTAEHPLTGVGVGSFHIVATDYIYRETGRQLAPDNAQNWWRHQVAELGLIGALPPIILSVLIAALVWRGGARVEHIGATIVLRAVLAGVGVASLLGVPTQHPASWLSFVTLLFWLAALSGVKDHDDRTPTGWWVAAFALAIAVGIGQWASANDDLRVPQRALRTGVPYSYGLSPPEGVSEYGELRWAASRAAAVVAVPNRWLRLTIWAPQPDVTSNPVTMAVSLNHRQVIEHTANSREPVSFYLQLPEGGRWALLELRASREWRPDRALQIATAWLRQLPDEVSPARAIR